MGEGEGGSAGRLGACVPWRRSARRGRERGAPVRFAGRGLTSPRASYRWCAWSSSHPRPPHRSATNIAYITVGTGIGVGAVVNGAPLHGLLHPEAGHLPVRRHPNDPYPGCLTTHAAGVESMACARALADRVGGPTFPVADLPGVPDGHPVWRIAAHYLGGLVVSLAYVLSPQVVVLGGGVLQRPALLAAVRTAAVAANEGYLDVPALTPGGVAAYVVRSRFGNSNASQPRVCRPARGVLAWAGAGLRSGRVGCTPPPVGRVRIPQGGGGQSWVALSLSAPSARCALPLGRVPLAGCVTRRLPRAT